MSDSFKIVKLKGSYVCISIFFQKNHHQFNTNFINGAISTLIMDNLSMIITSIYDKVKLHYKYKILYDKAWVAKQKVFEHFFSSHE
jgi:hypothetical protein